MFTRKGKKADGFAGVRRKLVFEGFRQQPRGNDVVDNSYPDTNSGLASNGSEVRPSIYNNVENDINGFGSSIQQTPISTSYPVTEKESKNAWNALQRRTNFELSEGQTDDGTPVSILVFLACMVVIPVSFLPWPSAIFSGFRVEETDDHNYTLLYENNPVLCIFGFLISCAIGAALSLTCCGFSWTVLYYDSLEPGKNPPTPFSPAKYRKKSGHTFHIGYALSLVNAALLFIYYLWNSRQSYLR